VDLLQGKLEAEGVVAGAFTVRVSDEEAKTIGEAVLYPTAKDENNDGKDDYTEKDMDSDEVKNRNGKMIEIRTTSAKFNSKIFVTPKNVTEAVLAVTQISDGEGFRVEVKNQLSEEIRFDWWIVETEN
jgi:hypothetical protein